MRASPYGGSVCRFLLSRKPRRRACVLSPLSFFSLVAAMAGVAPAGVSVAVDKRTGRPAWEAPVCLVPVASDALSHR